MTSASELIEERAALLSQLEEINAALKLLETPAKPVEIRTHKNLRNTSLPVTVYSSPALTEVQPERYHDGWITAEDAAFLRTEHADWLNDGDVTLYDG